MQLDERGMPVVVPTEVALVCPRQQAPKPAQEITINYGNYGNEMLLMSYGKCWGPICLYLRNAVQGCDVPSLIMCCARR